jgi:SpoVK/Ycf46/Vps4 family AAA+-type ATPase
LHSNTRDADSYNNFPQQPPCFPSDLFQGSNLSNYLNDEWRELSRQIARDLVSHDLGVTLDDVVGIGEAKQVVMEAVVYPWRYPEIYGHLEPWRGLLLHGPPGTGTSLMIKGTRILKSTTVHLFRPI